MAATTPPADPTPTIELGHPTFTSATIPTLSSFFAGPPRRSTGDEAELPPPLEGSVITPDGASIPSTVAVRAGADIGTIPQPGPVAAGGSVRRWLRGFRSGS